MVYGLLNLGYDLNVIKNEKGINEMIKKVNLGNTNEKVSALCLGCLNFGTKTSEETSFQLLDYYYETGGSFLDTANNYSFWNKGSIGGDSEIVLRNWMNKRNNRNSIFLATKVGAMPKDLNKGFDDMEGLSEKAITEAVEHSLQRLKTDHIDLCYAHIDDKTTPLEETLVTFEKLIKSGKIRYIGCSNYTYQRLIEALNVSERENLAKYCCIQLRYSYLQPKENVDFGVQEILTKELLSFCKENSSLSLLAYSPLLGGYYNHEKNLEDKYDTIENQKRMHILKSIAKDLDVTPNQLVLAWLMQSKPSVIPLVACSSMEQLQQNIDSVKIELTESICGQIPK